MCVAKGMINMSETQDFTNERGLHFLVKSRRNVAYILDEETEKSIIMLYTLLSHLKAKGAITEEQ